MPILIMGVLAFLTFLVIMALCIFAEASEVKAENGPGASLSGQPKQKNAA